MNRLIFFMLSILIFACTKHEKADDSLKLIEKEKTQYQFTGVDSTGYNFLRVKFLNDSIVYIKTYQSNYSKHYLGNYHQLNDSVYRIIPISTFGGGLCKSYYWMTNVLNISTSQDLQGMWKNTLLEVFEGGQKIQDTVITSFDPIPMPNKKDKSAAKIKVILSPKNTFYIEPDTMIFNYYRIGLCLDSGTGPIDIQLNLSYKGVSIIKTYETLNEKKTFYSSLEGQK